MEGRISGKHGGIVSKRHIVTIKGMKWKYFAIPKDKYVKKHPNTVAICMKGHFYMDFLKEEIDLPTVIHEVTHAFLSSCCLDACDHISPDDLEEIFAEVNGYHIEDILKVAKKIYKDLK